LTEFEHKNKKVFLNKKIDDSMLEFFLHHNYKQGGVSSKLTKSDYFKKIHNECDLEKDVLLLRVENIIGKWRMKRFDKIMVFIKTAFTFEDYDSCERAKRIIKNHFSIGRSYKLPLCSQQ
jgi:hypothetical protein